MESEACETWQGGGERERSRSEKGEEECEGELRSELRTQQLGGEGGERTGGEELGEACEERGGEEQVQEEGEPGNAYEHEGEAQTPEEAAERRGEHACDGELRHAPGTEGCEVLSSGHGEDMAESAGAERDPSGVGGHIEAVALEEDEIRADAVALLTAAARPGGVDHEGVAYVLAGYLSDAPSYAEVRLGVLLGSLLGMSRAHLQLLAATHECEVGEIIQALAIASQES